MMRAGEITSYMGPALIETYGYDYTGFRVKKTSLDGINVKTVYNIGGLYEVLVRPGERDSHTKYIFGINGEIAAQITMDDAELVSQLPPIVFDAKRFIINPGLYLQEIAVRILANAFVEAGDFINDIRNQRIIILGILILLSAVFLLAGAYYRIYRREESIFWLKWAADVSPVILVAFLWVFGFSGCGALPDDGSPKEGMYFYHPDHIGSIGFLTDDDGNKVSQVYYKPYGEIAEFTGEDIFHYKYTSQEQDQSTGLYYYQARFYDPLIGRFLTADSMVPDPMNSQSFNRYMYVKGNPVCYNDPSGHVDNWWYNYYTWLYSQNNTKDSTTNEGSSSQTGTAKTGGDTKPGNISAPGGGDTGAKNQQPTEPKKDSPNISPNQHWPGGNPSNYSIPKTKQQAAVNDVTKPKNTQNSKITQPDFINPTGGPIRVKDDQGKGAFGAPRPGFKGGRHPGIDIVGNGNVKLPIKGYAEIIPDGIRLTGRVNGVIYCVRMLHIITEITNEGWYKAGIDVATVRDLTDIYPGITNHVHLELYRIQGNNTTMLDPTSYFFPENK